MQTPTPESTQEPIIEPTMEPTMEPTAEPIAPTDKPVPTVNNHGQTNQSQKENGWIVYVVVGGCALFVAAGITFFLWRKSKKNKG